MGSDLGNDAEIVFAMEAEHGRRPAAGIIHLKSIARPRPAGQGAPGCGDHLALPVTTADLLSAEKDHPIGHRLVALYVDAQLQEMEESRTGCGFHLATGTAFR